MAVSFTAEYFYMVESKLMGIFMLWGEVEYMVGNDMFFWHFWFDKTIKLFYFDYGIENYEFTSWKSLSFRSDARRFASGSESFSLFFWDMAVRDLKVYAGTWRWWVLHYRDNAGLECDAVVHLDDDGGYRN